MPPSLRIAVLAVHTSPLHQPGTGDAGGMNVYLVQLSRALAERGAEVDLFTRCRGGGAPPHGAHAPPGGGRGPTGGARPAPPPHTEPGRVLEFALSLLRAESGGPHRPGRPYDLVHSHYWLSGQAGLLAAARWQVPLVHTMHTLARVKNAALADGDAPEPEVRIRGEEQVAHRADRLIVNTDDEAAALHGLYGVPSARTEVVRPGVDTATFSPGILPGNGKQAARARLGLPPKAFVPLFVGRIQALKAPDVLVRAVAELLRLAPELRSRLVVPVVGGLSGTGATHPDSLRRLGTELGVLDCMRFEAAVPQAELAHWYRAADVLVMPSRSESFGLVALEAQACGTPVLAAAVGGLPTAVLDGVTGFLVGGHEPTAYAQRLLWLSGAPEGAALMGRAAIRHAQSLSWQTAAAGTLSVYERAVHERAVGDRAIGDRVVGQGRRHAPAPLAAPSWRDKGTSVSQSNTSLLG